VVKATMLLNVLKPFPVRITFLLPVPVVDSEMDDRIARHKADRQGGIWRTIEEEINLETTIQTLGPDAVCLVDCLTLWVNNLMFAAEKLGTVFGGR